MFASFQKLFEQSLRLRVPRQLYIVYKRNIWGNMKVLANNCVSTVKIPEGVNSGNGVSFNPVLGLFVTMDFSKGISVWNHVSGEVMAECDLGQDGDLNMSLLPGNRVAVSCSVLYGGGSVEIYSLEKDTFDSSELELKVPSLRYPGVIALTPQKSLLVAGSVELDPGLYEIFIDWNSFKVLKMREICVPLPEEDEEYGGIGLVCGSPDGKVIRAEYEFEDYEVLSSLIIAKISLSSEQKEQGSEDEDEEKKELEQFKMQDEATISYYMLDGEENHIDNLRGFIHDGQNLIIAEGEKIVLLESLTEGSNAQLIVSGLKPAEEDSRKEVGMNLNHKEQLMDRIKKYMGKVKEATEKKEASLRIDKGAAKRFVKSALWNPSDKKDSLQDGGETSSKEANKNAEKRKGEDKSITPSEKK